MSKIFGITLPRKTAVQETLPPWRTDFRRKEELPDLKVIRTHFLLNYGSAALALALGVYAGWCELESSEVRTEIARLTSTLESGRVADETALAQSGEYSAYAATLAEFSKFREPPVDSARVLAAIGSVRAEGMTIKTVSVDGTFFNPNTKPPKQEVRIAVIGTQDLDNSQTAFARISDSYKRFRELKVWSEIPGRKPVSLPTPSKVATNLQNHVVEFTFELSLEEGTK